MIDEIDTIVASAIAEPARSPSGYRDYSEEAVERLTFIRDAQRTGLSLAEIQSVLELKDSGSRSCEHTLGLLEAHLADIDDRRRRDPTVNLWVAELQEHPATDEPGSQHRASPSRAVDVHLSRLRAVFWVTR